MRQPVIYTAETIKKWDVDTECSKGVWKPARPCGHNMFSIIHRFKLACLVLLGKYDVLNWEE